MLDRFIMQSLRFGTLFLLTTVVALNGCSSDKPAANTEAKPKTAESTKPQQKEDAAPQLETGRAAFQKVYASARIWAPDAQPLSLESLPRKGDEDGRASVWNAQFASAGKRSIRRSEERRVGKECRSRVWSYDE